MKFCTKITASATVVKPHSKDFKAIASSLKDRYGFDLKPQIDLLYVKACLVSAGNSLGINENDDIFTREEAWAARHTPVLKPINWQHQDHDILGVLYTVQALSSSGDVLDITSDRVPDVDFDFFVEAAVFSLIHPDKAEEIERRSKAGTLFVSMEAWFDDYSYGFYQNNKLNKIVSRNQNTSFLDNELRANGGAGVYHDPESDCEVRIGRVLRSITFGGCGFVDHPANKRSRINEAEPMTAFAERDIETQINQLLERVQLHNLEETSMNTQIPGEQIVEAVETALTKRERVAAEKAEKDQLVGRATSAEQLNVDLQNKVDEISAANDEKTTQVEALNTQVQEYNKVVEDLIREHVAASVEGVADFKSKIALIAKSMATLKARATRADELEAQLAEAEAVVREQEVRALLGDNISEEVLDVFVVHASKLSTDEYERWRDEKELMVIELTKAKEEVPVPPKKKVMPPKKEEEACANLFEALLTKRRSESGSANPATPTDMGHLINHPGGEGVNSGVTPEQLRTPRHKIAGSTAGNDPAQTLENAQAEGGVQLAGAKASGDGEVTNPFRTLAALVVNENVDEEKNKDQKGSDFVPVQ